MVDRVNTLDKAFNTFDTKAKAVLSGNAFQKKFLDEVDAARSEMRKHLAVCDANDKGFSRTDQSSANARSDMALQLQHYRTAADKYATECAATIAKLEKSIEQQKKIKALGDANAAEVLKGLKVLKTTLAAIEKENTQWHANSQSVVANLGKAIDKQAEIAKNFLTSLKAEVAKGLAAAQRVKADPTVNTYNAEMYRARNVGQLISNIPKLTAGGYALPTSIPANHATHATTLKPFTNGALMSMPAAATPAQVLAAIKQYNQALKAVVADFHL
jgi:hypothetical protein